MSGYKFRNSKNGPVKQIEIIRVSEAEQMALLLELGGKNLIRHLQTSHYHELGDNSDLRREYREMMGA